MEIIITNVGANKLEAIRAIRQLTSSSLKTAKDFAELVEKNYVVAISDIPQDQKNEVMQTLSSAGIRAEISRDTVPIFRKMPFNPSEKQIPVGQPIQLVSHYQSPTLDVRKKTDGSLKGYLKEVATLECQMWNQERLIQLLNRKAGGLARSREIDKPKKSSYYAKIKEIKKVLVLAGIAAAVIVPVIMLITDGLLWALLTLVIDFVLFGTAFLLLSWIDSMLTAPVYRKAMDEYRANLAADQKRVQREIQIKQEIQQQIESVLAERQKTQRALNALYALSIIHTDYRNLVAVSSFYDYIDKGICTQLEGRDGAYAFYEEALRFQRIESKLDIIIEKLDQIADNQQYLASLIREGNMALNRIEQQNNRMFKQLNAIHENTAITEYNTRCSAESLAVMESISIYRFLTN